MLYQNVHDLQLFVIEIFLWTKPSSWSLMKVCAVAYDLIVEKKSFMKNDVTKVTLVTNIH